MRGAQNRTLIAIDTTMISDLSFILFLVLYQLITWLGGVIVLATASAVFAIYVGSVYVIPNV